MPYLTLILFLSWFSVIGALCCCSHDSRGMRGERPSTWPLCWSRWR